MAIQQDIQDVTDEQWKRVESLFQSFRSRKDPRGRPSHDIRLVLNAVLWVLSRKAIWSSLPASYPDYRTCHRHFKAWYDAGVLQQALTALFGEEGAAMTDAMAPRMRTWRRPKIGGTARVGGHDSVPHDFVSPSVVAPVRAPSFPEASPITAAAPAEALDQRDERYLAVPL